MNKKVLKIAISGAIAAVAIDYFLRPSIDKTVNKL